MSSDPAVTPLPATATATVAQSKSAGTTTGSDPTSISTTTPVPSSNTNAGNTNRSSSRPSSRANTKKGTEPSASSLAQGDSRPRPPSRTASGVRSSNGSITPTPTAKAISPAGSTSGSSLSRRNSSSVKQGGAGKKLSQNGAPGSKQGAIAPGGTGTGGVPTIKKDSSTNKRASEKDGGQSEQVTKPANAIAGQGQKFKVTPPGGPTQGNSNKSSGIVSKPEIGNVTAGVPNDKSIPAITTSASASEQGQAKTDGRTSKRSRSRGGKKNAGATSTNGGTSSGVNSPTIGGSEASPQTTETSSQERDRKRTITPAAVDAFTAAMSAREQKAEEGGKKVLGNLQELISTLKTLPPPSRGAGGEGRRSVGGRGGEKDRQGTSVSGNATSSVASGDSPDKTTRLDPSAGNRPSTAPIAIPETSTGVPKLKADATPFTPPFASPTASIATQNLPSTLDPPPSTGGGMSRASFSGSAAGLAPAILSPPVQMTPKQGQAQQTQYQQQQLQQLQQQPLDINSQETLQTLITMQVQTMLQQIIGQHGAQGLTPEVVQAVQQQATMRALQQIAILNQDQQQRQAQAQLPPRFQQRGSVIDQPVYEEEAVDDSSEAFSPVHRAQNVHTRAESNSVRRRSSQGLLLGQGDGSERRFSGDGISGYGQAGQAQSQHGDRGTGINAGVLAGLAARAHARNGSEMTPLMMEQLELQRQIESLQEQQRQLLQQQSAQQQQQQHPAALSALSQALLSQQSAQMQSQREAQEAIYLQTMMQNQQLQLQAQAMLQAQAQAKAQQAQQAAQIAAFGQPRVQSPPAGQQLQDYILSGPQRQVVPPAVEAASRRLSDMGPPAAPSANHRRKDSTITRHRPTNSIIGSFGGYVPDMPDNDVSSHSRTASRSSAMGDWRFGGAAAGVGGAPGGQSDLASAQAQLQMLAQFRQTQIGAGGHSKMASFSFPNILPNLMMASTIAPVNQSIAQQQQAFQLQLQQNQGSGPGPARKSLFAPYLPQGSLPPLLTAGKLVVGVLRINLKNRSDAYVTTDVLDGDIFISGSKDRNRALNGDVVAVELLDVDEVWNAKKEKEEKKRRKEENAAYDFGGSRSGPRKPEKKDDIEVEGQGLVLVEEEEISDEQKPRYCGHVVAVVERMSNQTHSGQISVLRPSSAATKEKQDAERREREGDREGADRSRQQPQEPPKIIWHIASDRRTPLIAIPTNQAPADFVQNPEKYANRLFTAIIKRWPITSLHPFGALVEEIGEIGSIEVETAALLKNCNVAAETFAESTLKCLPPMPWSIPEREYETRRDMRGQRVFTIDPRTAKDLDDALSISSNPDGTYEVSVHIADVSFFIRPSTPLDRDARKRATSVYLVEKAVPMLPPVLCEQLCSLVPNVDRLAFSVFFTMDSEGNVLGKHFERTVINSCAKLAYEDAQLVIDGGHLPTGKEIAKQFDVQDVERDIVLLQMLAEKLRARRFKDGALQIDNVKLSFDLDENGDAIDCSVFEARSANGMVAEFMLLSNFAAAQVCANGLPEQALLRRHEAPIQRRIEGFVKRAKGLGFEFDGTTSTEIQNGFDAVDNTGDKLCLQIIATRSMNKAKYFCAGMLDIAKYSHFALNAPIYTHFTSPIRRYADVLVHRMLDACISSDQPETRFVMDRDQVAKCAQHCNAKKDAAKIAQEQSAHLHLCHLIHRLTQKYGPVVRDAKVVHVLDSAFDVVVPEFGIEKRVHADKVPIENHVYDEHDAVLSLYWSEQDVLSFLADNSDDEHLRRVRASSEKRHLSKEDEQADADAEESKTAKSKQEQKSIVGKIGEFAGLRKESGHRIQDIKELQTVPVIISADIMKSPPVIIVYAVNPYATE